MIFLKRGKTLLLNFVTMLWDKRDSRGNETLKFFLTKRHGKTFLFKLYHHLCSFLFDRNFFQFIRIVVNWFSFHFSFSYPSVVHTRIIAYGWECKILSSLKYFFFAMEMNERGRCGNFLTFSSTNKTFLPHQVFHFLIVFSLFSPNAQDNVSTYFCNKFCFFWARSRI